MGKWLPFAFLRSVHLQAPIIWIGVSWIGAGLFLAPLIGGREPAGQKLLVNLIFWVLVTIVAGALIGDYLGVMGLVDKNWFWFGNQGLSYLELGRFWQIAFFIGLAVWCLVLLRAFWPTLKSLFKQGGGSIYGLFRIEHLLWISTLTVALFYVFGMIPLGSPNPSFSITDFWRWWVVHLWVELAFELFTAAVTGYFLMALGLVSRQMVERAVIFEWILIFIGGVLGTGHHLYWAGEPGLWVGVGSMFSFVEVLPLVLLVLEAIDQQLHIREKKDFPYKLAYLYILGAAFWNFVGAGVFGGGTLNAPLVNYYEHGTFLTLNHAHTSMFGAFGLLAIGLLYMVLRYLNGDRPWSDRAGVWAFWLYNSGVVMWIVLNFYPIGWAQLEAVYTHGYAYARSMQFYDTTTFWQVDAYAGRHRVRGRRLASLNMWQWAGWRCSHPPAVAAPAGGRIDTVVRRWPDVYAGRGVFYAARAGSLQPLHLASVRACRYRSPLRRGPALRVLIGWREIGGSTFRERVLPA